MRLVMTNLTPEEIWEYTQKKYQLSKKELQHFRLWLANNPAAFHEWEKMFDKRPCGALSPVWQAGPWVKSLS